MAKDINIGGRLHSIATGNVVAGADEILDDNLGKKQTQINTETYSLVESVNNALAELSPDQEEALAVAAKANANEAKLGYYVCDTDADVAAKTISATGYALTTGGNIHIKMTNANTADAVTLNINSTGAKALFYNGEQASSTNSWEAGEVIEVYYDGSNYQASNAQGDGGKAEKIKYDNSQSGLAADNVQEALDKIDNGLVEDEKVIAQALLLHKEKIDKVEENANQVPSIKERLLNLESADELVIAHALTRLNSVVKNIGNGYKADYSEELGVIEIPKPTAITKMNIISSTLPASKATVLDATIEFWDKNGNYFKKPITEFTVQGNSSARYGFQKLNFGFDIADGSKIKFGDWVPQDSFHLKANFIDSFRGARNIIAYHVWEKQLNDRGWIAGRPWRKLADADITTSHGTGSLNEDFNSDAKGVPDGFAVKVYWNNEFYGLFTLQLKKNRDNYAMGKSKAKHIFIDGYLDQLFNGEDNINWTRFELRNPKSLKDIDGNKYDGDNPKELSDTDEFSATVKGYVKDLSNRCNAIASAEDLVAIIDKDYAIDYLLNVNYMGNDDVLTNNTMYCTWDGNLWFTLLYDSDQSFGLQWEGNTHSVNISRDVFGVNKATGTPMDKFFTWFKADMDARYKELRDNGIFDVKNIIKELSDWVAMIGTDNFETEFEKWNETPSYRDGSLTYTHNPQTGGFYDSIGTVEKWLKERTAFLDSYFNYNN